MTTNAKFGGQTDRQTPHVEGVPTEAGKKVTGKRCDREAPLHETD